MHFLAQNRVTFEYETLCTEAILVVTVFFFRVSDDLSSLSHKMSREGNLKCISYLRYYCNLKKTFHRISKT